MKAVRYCRNHRKAGKTPRRAQSTKPRKHCVTFARFTSKNSSPRWKTAKLSAIASMPKPYSIWNADNAAHWWIERSDARCQNSAPSAPRVNIARGATDPPFNIPRWERAIHLFQFLFGLSSGNKITSRIDSAPVSSMVSRSIPRPNPPAGGIPCSSASRNSSSIFCVSSPACSSRR
jgi:hypothetical protein